MFNNKLTMAPGGNNRRTICFRFSGPSHYKYLLLLIIIMYSCKDSVIQYILMMSD